MDIKSCKECPFFRIGETYSTDGWDIMEDWMCTKATDSNGNNRKIQGGALDNCSDF